VDRAKDFYKALGWREDADVAKGADFRVVQLTPPGSPCSVIFGTGSSHVLAREPKPLGDALGVELRKDGIELYLGQQATAARRDGGDYVLTLADGTELRGDKLLVATGRAPRIPDGLDTVGVTPGKHGVPVDSHCDLHPCLRRAPGVPDPAQRRPAPARRPRAGAAGQGVDAAGHAGHPGPGAAGGAAGRDPAVPTFSEIFVAGLKALRTQIAAESSTAAA
jgi:NADPH-dependent 2,4-dienoyl-CoA reductase/sulfur reductase-like enzyme